MKLGNHFFSTRASATIVEVTQALTAPVYLLFGFVLFPPFRKLPETKCQNNFFFEVSQIAAYICVKILCFLGPPAYNHKKGNTYFCVSLHHYMGSHLFLARRRELNQVYEVNILSVFSQREKKKLWKGLHP